MARSSARSGSCGYVLTLVVTDPLAARRDDVVKLVVDEVAEGLVVMTATTDHETADGVAEVVGEAECVSRLFRSQNPN